MRTSESGVRTMLNGPASRASARPKIRAVQARIGGGGCLSGDGSLTGGGLGGSSGNGGFGGSSMGGGGSFIGDGPFGVVSIFFIVTNKRVAWALFPVRRQARVLFVHGVV